MAGYTGVTFGPVHGARACLYSIPLCKFLHSESMIQVVGKPVYLILDKLAADKNLASDDAEAPRIRTTSTARDERLA